MPHIDIKMFPGRSDEMKKAAAEKIIEAASDALGTPKEAFSVAITDIEKDNWNETVANKIDESTLYAGKIFKM